MGNSKFHISIEAKEIIDSLKVTLEISDTPSAIKLALAKGITLLNGPQPLKKFETKNNWLVPENIIRDKDYILFKHLIINEYHTIIADNEINKYFAYLIELGTRELDRIIQEKVALQDVRIAIFS